MELVIEHGQVVAPPGEIFGWFDWEELYDRAVESAPPGSALVELGVFFGCSLAYLARKAKDANKGLRVYGVDTWKGSPEFDGSVWVNDMPINDTGPGFLLGSCYANLAERGLANDVILIVSDSADAASLFKDEAVHMVFVDAAHDEAGVARDIAAWRSRVKPGGIMAGHDYRESDGFPGVKAAVDAAFGDAVKGVGSWWEVQF